MKRGIYVELRRWGFCAFERRRQVENRGGILHINIPPGVEKRKKGRGAFFYNCIIFGKGNHISYVKDHLIFLKEEKLYSISHFRETRSFDSYLTNVRLVANRKI